MYLWCSRCQHAHPRIDWTVLQTKYGVCPTCGSSEYRNIEIKNIQYIQYCSILNSRI